MNPVWKFNVGSRVRLLRDLPSVRAHAEGVVRGVSANASGISYAIRFANTMRIVAESDLEQAASRPGVSSFSSAWTASTGELGRVQSPHLHIRARPPVRDWGDWWVSRRDPHACRPETFLSLS